MIQFYIVYNDEGDVIMLAPESTLKTLLGLGRLALERLHREAHKPEGLKLFRNRQDWPWYFIKVYTANVSVDLVERPSEQAALSAEGTSI